jgi:hypothetical protein
VVVLFDGNLLFVQFKLNLIGVDNASEIGTVNHVSLELIARFFDTCSGISSENFIERFKGITGENNESTNATTGGKLEEVESVDIADFNTGQVAGGLGNLWVGVTKDDEGSSSDGETRVTVLSLSGS